MLSLRSLAFILASAMRRARALACASFQRFPDIIGRKIATKVATRIATQTAAVIMQSPTNSLHLCQGDHLLGRKGTLSGTVRKIMSYTAAVHNSSTVSLFLLLVVRVHIRPGLLCKPKKKHLFGWFWERRN